MEIYIEYTVLPHLLKGAAMKLMRSLSIIVLSLLTISCQGLNQKKPWTIFVYIAGDNNLWPEADKNIQQMVSASNNSNVYIVVHLNIKRDGQAKQTQQLFIHDGVITQTGQTTVEDSGDPQTLIKALAWAVTEYPSDYLLVDLWNHGSGSLNRNMMAHRGVCYDDTTQHFMTDLDYKHALETIVNQYRNGHKIDVITFDACLMADLEVAYTLQSSANYLVSSQQTVPGPGFNYTYVINSLKTAVLSPAKFAKAIVSAFDKYYKYEGLSYSLSAVNLSRVTTVTHALNTLATLLSNFLKKDKKNVMAKTIKTCVHSQNMPELDETTYLDLYTFCSNLYLRATKLGLTNSDAEKVKTAARNCMTALTQAIFANVTSYDLANAKGISIYFADPNYGMESSYNDLYWTAQNPAWRDFLNAYLAKVN